MIELTIPRGDTGISIHSPHTRGDGQTWQSAIGFNDFNPLPSYEGRRDQVAALQGMTFQSAPLMRGETPVMVLRLLSDSTISIHSPHARGDRSWSAYRTALQIYFNPLPSCEGRRYVSFASFALYQRYFNPLPSHEGRQHKPPKIHPDLRQLTQQNHDTPLFGALQAPFCGAKPDIRGAKPTGKP